MKNKNIFVCSTHKQKYSPTYVRCAAHYTTGAQPLKGAAGPVPCAALKGMGCAHSVTNVITGPAGLL